jgi:tripartite-type tricarboxylate transporter receptor subunit TctC
LRSLQWGLCASAAAQTTRIVVPFAAAGGLDAVGRVLLGGRLQAAFVAVPVALPHIKSGALIPLAVPSRQRAYQLPAVPTVAERFREFEVGAVYL